MKMTDKLTEMKQQSELDDFNDLDLVKSLLFATKDSGESVIGKFGKYMTEETKQAFKQSTYSVRVDAVV